MAAAGRGGYRWPTVCGGLAPCGACVLEVAAAPVAGLAAPAELDAVRLAALPERRLRPDASWRLACQLQVDGAGLVARKRGVKRFDQGGT
jgi:2Fe-2S ferredoxin